MIITSQASEIPIFGHLTLSYHLNFLDISVTYILHTSFVSFLIIMIFTFLKTISITRILNCPSVFYSVILLCIQHDHGELAFINAFIPTHNLQSIYTYFGSSNLVQQFLKAASGKSIKQFYYKVHLVAPEHCFQEWKCKKNI